MSVEFKSLETFHVKTTDECVYEYIKFPKIIHFEDDALVALTDFKTLTPLLAKPDRSMMEIRKLMEATGMPLVLIIGAGHDVSGVLSYEEILSDIPLRLMEDARIERKEILLKMVMQPLANVPMIYLEQLKYAKVGHILHTLKESASSYLLVLEDDKYTGKKMIRGAFLSSHISKILSQ